MLRSTRYEGETPGLTAWQPVEDDAVVEMNLVQPTKCEGPTFRISQVAITLACRKRSYVNVTKAI